MTWYFKTAHKLTNTVYKVVLKDHLFHNQNVKLNQWLIWDRILIEKVCKLKENKWEKCLSKLRIAIYKIGKKFRKRLVNVLMCKNSIAYGIFLMRIKNRMISKAKQIM